MATRRSSRKGRAAVAKPPSNLRAGLAAFVTERHPLGLQAVMSRLEDLPFEQADGDANAIEALREAVGERLGPRPAVAPIGIPETTPGTDAEHRLDLAYRELSQDIDGWLRRQSIEASLTSEERMELLRGMLLTRATDNRLKTLFLGGEVRHGSGAFQGKGFRSLGQEAIYAAALRLHRGEEHRDANGHYVGDVVAPLIRDAGVALAMDRRPETVRMILNAQVGKAGPPMNGRDLHIGNLERGILPAAAPLSISTLTAAGMAMAFACRGEPRVAVSFIGEGGASLGEWHEAINLCAARRLPAIFCVQNNQTALSTPRRDQSATRVFADRAAGYGIPGITLDGTDPEAIAAGFAWAAERARAGSGPSLIELVSMRMCGHAHHDDMLYLGKEPPTGWEYPQLTAAGYADPESYAFWAARDPIATYAARLQASGLITRTDLARLKDEAIQWVQTEARALIEAAWPAADGVGNDVFAGGPPAAHQEPLADRQTVVRGIPADLPALDEGPPFDRGGRTFLEAVMLGVGDALREDPRVFVYGQDVGGTYGNAFLLLRPLLEQFGERIINSTLAESGVIGVCVGSALGGMRPIGEIQFNDFIATGFNQLVNNAAKIRYRWGGSVPMVLRMPWGGLRRAGPYHSQNTEPWFYRTPGLKIVVPSTPHDARGLMRAAIEDPDPVLYYEHIGLYRDPKIKQRLTDGRPETIPLGRAALRRAGSGLAIISYGAYSHLAARVADRLAEDGIEASVLDLRCLVPLDLDAILAVTRAAGKVLIVHEDSRTGGIGESLAAKIQELAFEYLDAPVRIVGALDTPVPYAPPLEDRFLPGADRVERAARLLVAY